MSVSTLICVQYLINKAKCNCAKMPFSSTLQLAKKMGWHQNGIQAGEVPLLHPFHLAHKSIGLSHIKGRTEDKYIPSLTIEHHLTYFQSFHLLRSRKRTLARAGAPPVYISLALHSDTNTEHDSTLEARNHLSNH